MIRKLHMHRVWKSSLPGFILILAPCLAAAGPPPERVDDAIHWLDAKSHELIRASHQEMKSGVSAFPPQAGKGYDAFWLRDYAYMLEGAPDAFSDQELRDACLLFVHAMRSDGSGVDCVKFDGTPIYTPGLGSMGDHPVADGSQFTVDVAWHTYQRLHDRALLAQIVDPLVKTLQAVPRDEKNDLVYIKPEGYDRCPYGFTDTVRKQGDELFCSLLLIQADRQLADLLIAAGRGDDAKRYTTDAAHLITAVRETFWDEKLGLFRAATLKCREGDLWGSAFAVSLGVTTDAQADRIAAYFKANYSGIIQRGQLRHLPAGTYWEAACPPDTYQNGGYWATPIGWFIFTLHRIDPKLADQTFIDLVRDFQQRGVTEWVREDHTAVKNYIASATMPLAIMRKLHPHRGSEIGP